ncbi:MAG: PDGLE domain-containing protein [Nitrospinota bacterium]
MKKRDIIFGLAIALFLAIFLSPFASPHPDGLERVAEEKGFLERGEITQVVSSPIPNYAWPNIENEALATALAGLAGTLIVFAAGYGLAALVKHNRG